jgi:hypothetical protein
MLSSDPELNALFEKAKAAFAKLTPEEKAAHRREQRISWVLGQINMMHYEHGHPERYITREQAEAAVDRLEAE